MRISKKFYAIFRLMKSTRNKIRVFVKDISNLTCAGVIGRGFPRILKSSHKTRRVLARKRAAAACGNYKPELRGNNATKDPTEHCPRTKLRVPRCLRNPLWKKKEIRNSLNILTKYECRLWIYLSRNTFFILIFTIYYFSILNICVTRKKIVIFREIILTHSFFH